MNLETVKDRNNIMLSKKALNDLCRIIYDEENSNMKIRNFLCPCGHVSTSEDKKEFIMISKNCDL